MCRLFVFFYFLCSFFDASLLLFGSHSTLFLFLSVSGCVSLIRSFTLSLLTRNSLSVYLVSVCVRLCLFDRGICTALSIVTTNTCCAPHNLKVLLVFGFRIVVVSVSASLAASFSVVFLLNSFLCSFRHSNRLHSPLVLCCVCVHECMSVCLFVLFFQLLSAAWCVFEYCSRVL